MNKKALLVLAVAGGLALTACGGDDDNGSGDGNGGGQNGSAESKGGGESNGVAEKSADEILTAAKDAALAAGSVHVSGEMAEGGGAFEIDMAVSPEAAAGTITIEGTDLELLSVEDKFYMKSDKAGWDMMAPGTGAGELLGGKYVLVPAEDESFSQMAAFTDFEAFVTENLTADGSVAKGEESDLDGTKVISLVDKSDEGTLYVATTGEPVPVQIDGPDGAGALSFEWGAEVDAAAPAEEDVVDMSQLG